MKTPIDRAMDAQHVKRWTLVATCAESNVASHSFNVAVLSLAIWKKMLVRPHISAGDLCMYAMLHDIDEVYTGDMPTPTKNAIRKMGVEPNSVFLGQGIEDKPRDEIKKIIHMADLIDNYIFIREYGMGARARGAAEEVNGRLRLAIDGASEDLRKAAEYVLDYVINRKSESDEERIRFEEDAERLRQVRDFSKFVVGGKPPNISGDTRP